MQKPTQNIYKGGNTAGADILEKLKYRLPMFLLSIHCFVTQSLFGDKTGPTGSAPDQMEVSTEKIFTIYYIVINVVCVLWTLWHSVRAYNNVIKKFSYRAFGFIICEVFTSTLLFVIVSNLSSFNIPFRVIFKIDRVVSTLIYGIAASIIYFANSIEQVYWSDLSNEYIKIEEKDDIQEGESLLSKDKGGKTYSSLINKTT
jgi:hypothetical protein